MRVDWLDVVAEVARQTGRVALQHFRSDLLVETKEDGSPVTRADREAEDAARSWIRMNFPGDSIIGEEGTQEGPANARHRWVIDPIDGTKSFVKGVPLWGTLIGVMRDQIFVAGAIFCPAVDEMVVAADGAGCWHNGSRCSVSPIEDLQRATLLTTSALFRAHPDRQERWNALAQRVAIARTWGDCYGYLLLASGRAEVMLDDRLRIWDFAPLVPIIREAGGVITDWRGVGDAFGGDAIATNRALALQVREALLEPARPSAQPT